MQYKDRVESLGVIPLGFAVPALIALFILERDFFTLLIIVAASLFVSGIGFALAKYKTLAIGAFLASFIAMYLLMNK